MDLQTGPLFIIHLISVKSVFTKSKYNQYNNYKKQQLKKCQQKTGSFKEILNLVTSTTT